jgi:hypothetical protein
MQGSYGRCFWTEVGKERRFGHVAHLFSRPCRIQQAARISVRAGPLTRRRLQIGSVDQRAAGLPAGSPLALSFSHGNALDRSGAYSP